MTRVLRKKTDVYTKTEIDTKMTSVYKASGNVTFDNLPAASETTIGNVYNITDAFTTTAAFIEGAGKPYPANTNVVVVTPDSGVTYKYDVLAGSGFEVASEEDIDDIIAGIYADDDEDEDDEGGEG